MADTARMPMRLYMSIQMPMCMNIDSGQMRMSRSVAGSSSHRSFLNSILWNRVKAASKFMTA